MNPLATLRSIITITSVSPNFARYFDWLITGLGQLSEQGKIELRFELPPVNRLLCDNRTRWMLRRATPTVFYELDAEKRGLDGVFETGGRKCRFHFDVADAPFEFDLNRLESCDVYFKAQFPSEFPAPVRLSRDLSIPAPAGAIAHTSKIRSAMLGRPLARSLDWRRNFKVLKTWESMAATPKEFSILAYFGGVTPAQLGTSERSGVTIGHPNGHRCELVKMLRSFADDKINARMINAPDRSLVGPEIKGDHAYGSIVSKSCWNANVSGIDMSIPFRFIDSFMTGTGVLTDSLAVKWHTPFSEAEVQDIGSMGYERPADVDWNRAAQVIGEARALSTGFETRRREILDRYRKHWSPTALAQHVIDECAATF